MANINYRRISYLLLAFLAAELLSFWSFSAPAVQPVIFIALALLALAATMYRLDYGLFAVGAELLIGSFGYLIYWEMDGRRLPFRLVLWGILMLVFALRFIWQLLKRKGQSSYWRNIKNFAGGRWFWLLAIFVVIGLLNGLLRHHAPSVIFADANAWLYFLTILPALALYGDHDKTANLLDRSWWFDLFLAGAFWLSLKTMFLLFVFTHDLSMASAVYNWLRRTLVGEMTPTLTGWPRVFIQGQIYPALAFFLIFWEKAKESDVKKLWSKDNLIFFFLSSLFLSVVLISFSRSFWVGLAAALLISGLWLWCVASFRLALLASLRFVLSLAAAFLIIYLVAAWPYWHREGGNFSSEFLERATSGNEAALASRWSLLPVLGQAIAQEPVLGQGYGATVTYFSRDPRILQNNPSGEYSTYAFEWGYLDMWLKIGVLGLFAYILLLGQLLLSAIRRGREEKDYLFYGLAAGLIFLAVTNFFTPYLNHPLGIGALLAGSCLIWLNKVY